MGLFGDRVRKAVGPVGAIPELARAERVSQLVPAGAEYVTVGQFAVLPDVRDFLGVAPGQGAYRRQVGLTPRPDALPREAGLLILAQGRLSIVAEDGERWSCEAAEVTDLDAHRHSGFVVVSRGTSGLIVSPQTPVQVPPEASWRTMGRVTNAVGGWDKVLKPFGTVVHW